MATKSVARDIPTSLSKMSAGLAKGKVALEKDPRELWRRYVQWLYQHKELGLYLDVSRMGFTDEFVEDMEPKLQAAFRAMEELDKGAIANPDEGRMVGHYWLRNSKLAPNEFLRLQIENALEAVCNSRKTSSVIKPPLSPEVSFKHIVLVLEVLHLDHSFLQMHWLLIIPF
ncbi:Glucose-6-phosphate isomerase [Bertholletia excelsa]